MMKHDVPDHYRKPREKSFADGFLDIFSGFSRSSRAPLRYPRDAQHQDLKRIGRDMCRAFDLYEAERKPQRGE